MSFYGRRLTFSLAFELQSSQVIDPISEIVTTQRSNVVQNLDPGVLLGHRS